MKNLKKVLALALTFAMAISMFASAAFIDEADISADHAADVAMLVELGVLGGYPDGSFKPQNTITRAEFAKMAYTIKYGKDDSGMLFSGTPSTFSDVEGNANVAWAKGYINYCANQGIVGGVGGNKFDPQGNITVAQVAKMLLVILGAKADLEGYGGAAWMGNVVADAMELGVFDGWVGDPAAPATRELVATLMRNTIFAPTYEYDNNNNGSQKNLLGVENPTLGEKTMGLKHIEGIIAANDTCYITVDEDHKLFGGLKEDTAEDKWLVKNVAAEDEATLVFEELNAKNELEWVAKDFEIDVPNSKLGTKVHLYYSEKNGKTTILGDVIPSADSVVYELTAADIKFMPEEENVSGRAMVPYIAIDAGEKEFQVRPTKGGITVIPADEAKNGGYDGRDLLDYFFFGDPVASGKQVTGKIDNVDNTVDHDFIKELGTDSIQPYRAVSLDGGKSISYIFRTATKELTAVATYSEDNDMLTVRGFTAVNELEENAVINGEIAKGDDVIAWAENDKLYVDALETISGLATVVDDNEVTIGGNNYKGDFNFIEDTKSTTDLANYYIETGRNTEATEYLVYGNYIVGIEGKGTTVSADQYAAVVMSTYDDDLGAAKVRLAFADETVGTYVVGKVDGYKMKNDTKISFVEFYDNAQVGNIYRYAIAADGTVNLYTDNGAVKNDILLKDGDGVRDDMVVINSKEYVSDANSIVFMLFGGLEAGKDASKAANYNPIEAVVYKIEGASQTDFAKVSAYDKNTQDEMTFNEAAYVMDEDAAVKTLVAATMLVGKKEPDVISGDGSNIAYLLSAKYGYDSENQEYFANVAMITEDGLVDTKTVNGIDDKWADSHAAYGGVPKTADGTFERGTLVEYALNDAGLVTTLRIRETDEDLRQAIPTTGFAYATIAAYTDTNISYYPYDTVTLNPKDNTEDAAKIKTIKKNKYEFVVIAIDDGAYVDGGDIDTISKKDSIPAGGYNAIVQARNGEAVRVFSFYNNIG